MSRFTRPALLACAGQPAVSLAPVIQSVAPTPPNVVSTASTQDSGLLAHLLPIFTVKTGFTTEVIAPGTGRALVTGWWGDADVVFVDAEAAEATAFVTRLNGPEGQKAIADHEIGGQPPFAPDADQPGA